MGDLIRLLADISAEIVGGKEVAVYTQNAKRKEHTTRIIYMAMLSFRVEVEIKNFPDKQKLKMFITTNLALQEMLKGLL